MTDLKAWLTEVVDETENIDKQSYDNYIEHFEKEDLHFIRKTIFREKPKNEEALKEYSENMKISLVQFYEKWKNNKKERESLEEASKPYVIPAGVSLITKIAVVLYELKQANPEQFNWFCKTFCKK
jgi:hypothetical protein